MPFLNTLVALLAASVLLVPLSRRLGFGSILGYLAAGLAIGPSGLGLVRDVEAVSHLSELGVVMLLFLIGLELRPARLWVMRKAVLGLGGSQVLCTGAALSAVCRLSGLEWPVALLAGFALALSSTAIVLPLLGERQLLQTPAGRDSFSVLLFQDMAFIPFLALVPLLGTGGGAELHEPLWLSIGRALGLIVLILIGGRYFVRSLFRMMNRVRTRELFTAAALLIVAGTALLVGSVGLSMSLGAFMAGVILADSEYRHALRADIEPFEGLLMGFFFMAVGMQTDIRLFLSDPAFVLGAVGAVIGIKALMHFVLGRLAGHDHVNAARFALALPQGSEFGFILFGAAASVGALSGAQAGLAMLVISLTMMATPVLFALQERWLASYLRRKKRREYDRPETAEGSVIICGFGRVGQIVGRVLRMKGIAYTALDRDAEMVDIARKYGSRVYYGDPTRADLLRTAGAEKAKALVVALDDIESSLKLVEMAKREFPNLVIYARAHNRNHAHLLMDRGVTHIIRETLHSSLRLSEKVLVGIGISPERAHSAVEMFREHDERILTEQHAIYHDEYKLIQTTIQAAQELDGLFKADRMSDDEPEKA